MTTGVHVAGRSCCRTRRARTRGRRTASRLPAAAAMCRAVRRRRRHLPPPPFAPPKRSASSEPRRTRDPAKRAGSNRQHRRGRVLADAGTSARSGRAGGARLRTPGVRVAEPADATSPPNASARRRNGVRPSRWRDVLPVDAGDRLTAVGRLRPPAEVAGRDVTSTLSAAQRRRVSPRDRDANQRSQQGVGGSQDGCRRIVVQGRSGERWDILQWAQAS